MLPLGRVIDIIFKDKTIIIIVCNGQVASDFILTFKIKVTDKCHISFQYKITYVEKISCAYAKFQIWLNITFIM